MAEAFQYDVFLSHSAKDKAVVRPLAERLREAGLRLWFDEWEIKPGDSIPAKIEEGLEQFQFGFRISDFGFAQPGKSANAFELQTSAFSLQPLLGSPLNKERRFIPLRLDDAPIKSSLAQSLYINWLPKNREQTWQAA